MFLLTQFPLEHLHSRPYLAVSSQTITLHKCAKLNCAGRLSHADRSHAALILPPLNIVALPLVPDCARLGDNISSSLQRRFLCAFPLLDRCVAVHLFPFASPSRLRCGPLNRNSCPPLLTSHLPSPRRYPAVRYLDQRDSFCITVWTTLITNRLRHLQAPAECDSRPST